LLQYWTMPPISVYTPATKRFFSTFPRRWLSLRPVTMFVPRTCKYNSELLRDR
jgi:hypothetical protein